MIARRLSAILLKSSKSLLLLGPRQTGKSTLVSSLNPELTINLAHEPTFITFVRNPHELEQRLASSSAKRVVLDEVQRLPSLLNTIQVLLDQRRDLRFLLTGSSARRLKRGHANLLPGRVHTYNLGPLVSGELDFRLDSERALSFGTLPGIYLEETDRDRSKTLRSYASTYLKEEIQAEALTRNLEGFARFLFVAATGATMFLDLSKLASEAQISRASAIRYFEILEETLIVRRCSAFANSERRRLVQHPRYFFFDNGVLNALLESFSVSSDRKGMLFEHLLFNQLVDSAASHDLPIRISSYRTSNGAEVDFIVELNGETWAIEAKSSVSIAKLDTRGLEGFREYYGKPCHLVVAYMGSVEKRSANVSLLPWQALLKRMGL
jgi:uncharacterized protein